MTYQCNDCAGPERLHAAEEKTLGKLYAKKYPHENVPDIQSRQQRLKMRRALHHEFSPNFKATRDAQELGRQRFIQNAAAGKKYPKKRMANLRRHWLGDQLPQGIRFGICIFCKNITMTHSDNPRFHWACHNEWERTPEGRQFQSLRVRGQEASEGSLAPSKGGRPKRYSDKNAGDRLATAYMWLIQYCSPEKKSLRQIGEKSGVPFNTVRDQIASLVQEFKKLNLELLADGFQPVVRHLLAAYDEKIREIKGRALSSIPSSNLPSTI
jgi:hypothetical protein